MIELIAYTNAETYLEPAPIEYHASYSRFGSLKGRWIVLKTFFKKIFIFPFAIIVKLIKTVALFIPAFLVLLKFIISLGFLQGAKWNLMKRMQSFGKDVTDWITLPFTAGICFLKMFLGFVIHPALYFGI